jgi:hypothetical protein
VHEPEVVEEGLTRLVKVLAPTPKKTWRRPHDRPDHHPFVPAGTRVFLRRRLEEVFGILLFVLAAPIWWRC